jgi:hypothetical protein
MVPQLFAARGSRPCLDFWAVTSDPQYPGYMALIVAPEPAVERVARAVHSTRGRISTHMSLRVPPPDLVVRPWS